MSVLCSCHAHLEIASNSPACDTVEHLTNANTVFTVVFSFENMFVNFLKLANISCVYASEKSNTLKAKNYALSNFSL